MTTTCNTFKLYISYLKFIQYIYKIITIHIHSAALLHRLMMGFMIVSAFLSMWISNTATSAMMLPIANAVLEQLRDTETQADMVKLQDAGKENHTFELETKKKQEEMTDEKQPHTQLEDGVCK